MTVHQADIVLARIDKAIEDDQEDGFRDHLGGSLIGEDCLRALWYSFRWATLKRHKASLLRLFNRGHLEEARFVAYLERIGAKVLELDPETGKQWRILDVDGHFGGSLDGIAYNLPGVEKFGLTPDDPVLTEFKTHGQKSFDSLVKDGLVKSKPKHYSQMQTYMVKRGIRLGLYMAVNKNTDELYVVWVEAAPQIGAHMLGKARDVIVSPIPMPRISNNPSWFMCRFCDHYNTCHKGEPMAKNCRTCAYSKPIEDGKWHCARWGAVIPSEHQRVGCDHWSEIPQ